MKTRYIKVVLIILAINFINWLYILIFCGVYPHSVSGLINGLLLGILIDWCLISIAFPLIKATLRIIIRNFPRCRFLVYIEYLFLLTNFI